MPNFHKMLPPSDFLASWDFEEGSVVAEIESVKMAEVGAQKERWPVVYFKGGKKGLVLKRTNGELISKILGSQKTEDWVGKSVELFCDQCDAFGTVVDCVRVRAPQ